MVNVAEAYDSLEDKGRCCDEDRHYTRERKDTYSVIDYILSRDTMKRKFSKLKMVDDYCGSDHRLLMAGLSLNADIKR
eukprot:Awhi_evm1s11586